MNPRSRTRFLSLLGAFVLAGSGLACSTDSPTAPRQGASPPIDIPAPTRPADAEVVFTCEAAPEGAEPAGRRSVAFTNESTEHYTEFFWRFGDGATSRQRDPSHTYRITAQRRQYEATLAATAAHGTDEFSLFVPTFCEGFEPPDDGEDDGDDEEGGEGEG
ncbi:MAG: PKD domain-containing protein [Thermoanaerobaculia bacterium]